MLRKFISEKFSTPGQTFDDKFPTVGTTAFEKFQSLLGFRFPGAVFQIPKPRIPDSERKSSLIPKSGFPYITWFQIERGWYESVYYGINNTSPI